MWYEYLLVASVALAWVQDPPASRGSLRDLVRDISPLRRSALVLLVNAIILNVWFAVTHNNDNALLNLVVDTISAVIIVSHPAGREQGWLAMTFAFQIGCDWSALSLDIRGFGIPNIQPSYWQALNYAGILQILILLGWGETHGCQIAGALRNLARPLLDRASRGRAGLS